MTLLKTALAICLLAFVSLNDVAAHAFAGNETAARVAAIDPTSGTLLNTEDKLFLRIVYQSDLPLRFQVTAYLEDQPREVNVMSSPGTLHAPGEGEALVWIGYNSPMHIDEVRISLLDAQWQRLATLSETVDIRWRSSSQATPRTPATWVEEMSRAERRIKDYVHDPAPRKYGTLLDLIFLLTVASVPAYLIVQVQMLRLYRGRWRELAAIPLVTWMPLVIYGALIGYGIDANLWMAIIFRCTPFALLYLLALWLIKRIRAKSPAG